MIQTATKLKSVMLAVLGVVLLCASVGCNGGNASAQKGAGGMPPMPVPIVVAQAAPVNISSEYLAMLRSRNSTTIKPQVEGHITQIFVKSGDRVDEGTPLLQIDPVKQQATTVSQEATRAAREANLELAKEQLARAKKLFAEGVVSRQELDQAQSAHDAAQAEVKALEAQVQEQRVQLRYYKITAPAGGIVGDIPVHIGDRVTSDTTLTTINKPGDLEAYIEVPVERSRDLEQGKAVQIIGQDGKPVAESRISFISPRVGDGTQTILAKAMVPNDQGRLRTEQLVRARVVWGARPAILIPILAVSRISGQAFAFVAEPTDKGLVAHQRQLTLGEMVGNDYVVLEGIKPGEQIITGGTQMLAEGSPVTAQPNK